MTQTKPLINYPAIMTRDGTIVPNVIRTRENWNTLSGTWVEYTSQVTNVLRSYTCPICRDTELLWDSQFNIDNDYVIFCDTCPDDVILIDTLELDDD